MDLKEQIATHRAQCALPEQGAALPRGRASLLFGGAVGLATVGFMSCAGAQSIEPRSFSNAPIGVNFVLSGIAHTEGGVSLDPALPVTDPKLSIWSGYAALAHVFEIGGQSATWSIAVPYASLSGEADFNGQRMSREQSGIGDVLARVAVNLYGAPATDLQGFRNYQQDLIVGTSLTVSAPTGAYDDARLVNIGTHRWSIKPELGVSKALGDWVFDAAGAVTLYTDNNDFYGGKVRQQAAIYSLQSNAIYTFRPALWAALGVTYYRGGRTTINGETANDLQDNWRVGGTLALPIDRLQSIKLSASNGVAARTGNNFTLLALSYQVRWGSGL